MDLKLELPEKLYDDLKKHNALSLIEAITNNEHNFISVGLYAILNFKDKDLVERIDYKSNESIPPFDIYPESMIICLSIKKSTTFAEINRAVERIKGTFNTNDVIFGTRIDESISDNSIVISCLLFRNLEWKENFSERFYDDIVKCNFLKSFYTIISLPSIISICMDELVNVSNDDIVGAISQKMNNLYEEFKPTIISDIKPNKCLLYIASEIDRLNLSDIDVIIDRIRKQYGNIELIFGCGIHSRFSQEIEVHALLLYESEEIKKKNLENKEKDIIEKPVTKRWKSEKDLAYDIAIYCKNNPITINDIRNEYGLPFSLIRSIIERLERLQIISIKIGTRPRTMLITDDEEIKYRIYTIN